MRIFIVQCEIFTRTKWQNVKPFKYFIGITDVFKSDNHWKLGSIGQSFHDPTISKTL